VSEELPPGVRSNMEAQAPAPRVMHALGGSYEITGFAGNLRAWQAYSFAPAWYSDAKHEATQLGRDARRREVLFAVAAAECGLFEWVRDQVLQHDYKRLEHFFDPENPRSILYKWKEVPKSLLADNLIAGLLDPSRTTWQNFVELVGYRNGLVHGGASRPTSEGIREASQPVPDIKTLDALAQGWAVGVVKRLMCELVTASGREAPDWLDAAPAPATKPRSTG
jgi:hypothetical protein